MEDSAILFILGFVWLFFGLLGWAIGTGRGLGLAGFALGVLLGPVGLIIVAILRGQVKPRRESREYVQDYALERHRQRRAAAAHRPPAGYEDGIPPPPGAAAPVYRLKIARGGEIIGEWTMPEIQRYLREGSLTPEDYYYDGEARDWLPLAAHRMIQL